MTTEHNQAAETDYTLLLGRAAAEAIDDLPYERENHSDEHTWRVAGDAALLAARDLLAEAWDAGHLSACEDAIDGWCGAGGEHLAANPYRNPARDDHAYWASVCTCGMAEQERTGHYPEHERWCDVPSPLDDEEE